MCPECAHPAGYFLTTTGPNASGSGDRVVAGRDQRPGPCLADGDPQQRPDRPAARVSTLILVTEHHWLSLCGQPMPHDGVSGDAPGADKRSSFGGKHASGARTTGDSMTWEGRRSATEAEYLGYGRDGDAHRGDH